MAKSAISSEEPTGVEYEASVLAALAKIPSITAAWISSSSEAGNIVTVSQFDNVFQAQDVDNGSMAVFQTKWHLILPCLQLR